MKNLFKIEVPEKRNFGLDLLRFIAIFTVLVSHSITVLPDKYYFVHKFITDGVLIFFVLSGFLIGRILIRDFKDGITLNKILHFWKRRWFRTLPAYYFTVLLLIFFSVLFHKDFNLIHIIKASVFAQNITYQVGYFFPESWSLAIEEWFYLTFPLIILILPIVSTKKKILISVVLLIILSLISRLYFFKEIDPKSIGAWDSYFRSSVISRLDSIAIGVFGAWFYTFKNTMFVNYKNHLFYIGIVIFIINKIYVDYFFKSYYYLSIFYLTLIPFSVLLTIPKLYYLKKPQNILLENIIIKGSLISYSMYLINLSLISYLILNNFKINMWISFGLFWILTIMGSILMYKFIELPFMRLRERLK